MKEYPLSRFWDYVDKSAGRNGCWVWTGNKFKFGYGSYGRACRGNTIVAHRISWELCRGKIPRGLFVLHQCDNPPCVNPRHLYLGTQDDNMKDRSRRNRQPKGEQQSMSKLRETDIPVIRARKSNQRGAAPAVARDYGVHPCTIKAIWEGRAWKHVK